MINHDEPAYNASWLVMQAYISESHPIITLHTVAYHVTPTYVSLASAWRACNFRSSPGRQSGRTDHCSLASWNCWNSNVCECLRQVWSCINLYMKGGMLSHNVRLLHMYPVIILSKIWHHFWNWLAYYQAESAHPSISIHLQSHQFPVRFVILVGFSSINSSAIGVPPVIWKPPLRCYYMNTHP